MKCPCKLDHYTRMTDRTGQLRDYKYDANGNPVDASLTLTTGLADRQSARYWVVEFDIKGAFDNIDHALLMKAVRSHISEDWILLYIERWLTAPFEAKDGTRLLRERGTPQGGVISPILMNLFMHYAFDRWMQRTYPPCPFARYADDAVVHCRRLKQAESVMQSIAARLEECGLTMHPEKSKIVYCTDGSRRQAYPQVQFTFLGFTFRPRRALSKHGRVFTNFLPGVSRMTRECHVRFCERLKVRLLGPTYHIILFGSTLPP